MDNPRRSRNRAAWVLAASVLAMLTLRALPKAAPGSIPHLVVMIAAMAGAMFGGVWMLLAWIDLRRFTRLKAGVGVIARWTVDAARWEWFRALSKEWDKRPGVRPNYVDLDQTPDPAGIEIVVTRDCMLVGKNFQSFEFPVMIQGHADWMEFHYLIHKRSGPPMHVNLRVPLAPGGQHHATRIVEDNRQARAVRMSGVRAMIYMFLGIIFGMAAITGVVTLLVKLLKRP